MSFNEFIFEQGILGITIGTMSGFGVTNLIKDMKTDLIQPLLKRLNVSNIKIISSFIEFITILLLIYLIYKLILYPLFEKEIKAEKKVKQREKKWKDNLLKEIKSIDHGNVYM
jgi:large-conductance mechanosensitive channel